MKFLRSNIDEKPIVAAFLVAIIVGLICLIIYVNKYFVPQLELPPKLVAKTSSGQEVELLLLNYDWYYKGEHKQFNPGQDSRFIDTYAFNGDNTLYNYHSEPLEQIEICTLPKYKVKGFTTNRIKYQYLNENYESTDYNTGYDKDKTKISYYLDSDTSLLTVTIYSENQGEAVYGLKIINTVYSNINKAKELGSLNFDKESIFNYLKEQTYGRYLNNIEIDNNRVVLTYDYVIDSRARQMYSNLLFALISDLDEIEFKSSFDKYVEGYQDPDYLTMTYTDKDILDPMVYSRNSFIDTYLDLPLEELEAYFRK